MMDNAREQSKIMIAKTKKSKLIGERTFFLGDDFVQKYATLDPGFGFNGLGHIVYMRTYSRLKANGENERWHETVRRVVEGIYSVQKNHITFQDMGWDEDKGRLSAEEMYDRIFYMKFLPPGRALWAMGTNIIEEKGLFAALNNCAFVSTKDIAKDPVEPFTFLMDMNMLGVGVGFDTLGAGKAIIQEHQGGETQCQIPDSREGWVDSVGLLIGYYFGRNQKPIFDYSLVRKCGEPIKTFGGKASGPENLMKIHALVEKILANRNGQAITSSDIVDIMNIIGTYVIAGNVRRSSELALGSYDDKEYMKLKDYKWSKKEQKYVGPMAHRSEYGGVSNNSVFAELGMDYGPVSKQIAVNGEPGLIWLGNIQKYSRTHYKGDYKDKKAVGTNPCGEQSLESYELCCLVEVFPTRCTDLHDFNRTLKFAYLYAKSITLGHTHWSKTNKVLLRNRRIGTSMSGITQFKEKFGIQVLKEWCKEGYETIQKYDDIYSEWLGVPRSIKTTSIKPSGTVSLLAGVTPGVHYPESRYYLRRMRIGSDSELVPRLIKAGYNVEKHILGTDEEGNTKYHDATMVVEVPVAIESARTLDEVSVWEQVSMASFMQEYWSDNQVSCTATFRKDEAGELKQILEYFQYKLKGISFLPKMGEEASDDDESYTQIPYERITKEQYDVLAAKIKKIDFSGIAEDSIPEKYCSNDVCTIDANPIN
jgi:ribonucleoside-triphosphate reductase (thioredoxin)